MTQRWYPNRYPEVNDCVMVKCVDINDMGCYCELLEYGNIEGLIPAIELSRQRIQHIRQVMAVGRIFVATVISTDPTRGYIDLSKKRVSETDIHQTESRYYNGKKVYSLLYQLAKITSALPLATNLTLSQLYERLWSITPQSQHPLDSLSSFFPLLPEDPAIQAILQRFQSPKWVEYQAEVDLCCFSIHGIEGIRQSLRAGLAEHPGLSIKLLRSPTYLLQYRAVETDPGLPVLQQAIQVIGKVLRQYGGELVVSKAAAIVTKEEQARLARRIQTIERENEPLSGDSDSDSY